MSITVSNFDSLEGQLDSLIGDWDNLGITAILSANSVTTSVVSVQQVSLLVEHGLLASDVLTGNTSVVNATLSEQNLLTPTVVVLGQPTVSDTSFLQEHSISGSSVVTLVVQVSSTTLQEVVSLSSNSILLQSYSLPSAGITQDHTLSPRLVVSQRPVVETTQDPNAIVQQEIKEIQQMFGGWQRRAYEVPDGRLVQAEREIQRYLGDVVSVDKKAKSLIKFGKSAPLATGGLQTVWTLGGNESYLSSNTITHVCSSSASDVYDLYLEGHTVTGSGQDQQFTFVTQTVTLQGQTPVALTTPLARCSMMTNNNGTEFVGRITVFEDTPVVGGVPSDVTKIHDQIEAGFQQSFKAATTFSDSDYYILTGGFGSVSLKQDAAVDFYLEVREAGKVFIQRAAISATSGGPWQVELDPAVIIPKNADVRITCETSTQGAVVFGVFKGYLAQVVA